MQNQEQSKEPEPSDNREELDFQFDEELPANQAIYKSSIHSTNHALSSYLPASFFPHGRHNRHRTTSLTLDLHAEQ